MEPEVQPEVTVEVPVAPETTVEVAPEAPVVEVQPENTGEISFVLKQDGEKFFWKKLEGSTFVYTSALFDSEDEAKADMELAK